MDPRSKPNAAIHQFLVSGRGAVAVEFAFVLPIILLIIWAFWQMSESYRLQWTLNRQTASLADMLINQPEQLNFGGGFGVCHAPARAAVSGTHCERQ